ncbi:hypothetical protein LCGC14_2739050 [marine sediment metagenome]|uniref:DUF4395 domain-containing protein n=1 Tax=marine sediment metagenome TaxID=412755 RepID=A0A0F9BWP7_9ZZZZ
MSTRVADPYRDTDVIDARAPRTNQAVIGGLALVAVLAGQAWLLALLAAQLALGLTVGRRWCLPCLLYFELIQPRFGEGPLEDARPPRFANLVGLVFLAAATAFYYAGVETVAWVLGSIVAALALLAATTGVCMGCEAYRLSARLRGVAAKHVPRIEPADVDLSPNGEADTVVHFSHPLCSECLEWEQRLEQERRPHVLVDVAKQPELARKYGIAVVPTVVSVAADGTVLQRLAP